MSMRVIYPNLLQICWARVCHSISLHVGTHIIIILILSLVLILLLTARPLVTHEREVLSPSNVSPFAHQVTYRVGPTLVPHHLQSLSSRCQ